MTLPKVGAMAPAFATTDETGKAVKLADLKGRWVVLFFYPVEAS